MWWWLFEVTCAAMLIVVKILDARRVRLNEIECGQVYADAVRLDMIDWTAPPHPYYFNDSEHFASPPPTSAFGVIGCERLTLNRDGSIVVKAPDSYLTIVRIPIELANSVFHILDARNGPSAVECVNRALLKDPNEP